VNFVALWGIGVYKIIYIKWPTQVVDHLVPSQTTHILEFFGKERGEEDLFSKAWKSPLSAEIQDQRQATSTFIFMPYFGTNVSPGTGATGCPGTSRNRNF